jgi:hypothetical protein
MEIASFFAGGVAALTARAVIATMAWRSEAATPSLFITVPAPPPLPPKQPEMIRVRINLPGWQKAFNDTLEASYVADPAKQPNPLLNKIRRPKGARHQRLALKDPMAPIVDASLTDKARLRHIPPPEPRPPRSVVNVSKVCSDLLRGKSDLRSVTSPPSNKSNLPKANSPDHGIGTIEETLHK